MTALTGVFDGMGLIDGVSMVFSGDIMGGLQMIFDGIVTTFHGFIDGIIVFITELFGGLFDVSSSPFKVDIRIWVTCSLTKRHTLQGFLHGLEKPLVGSLWITRPFQGGYDLVVGIFTFDLEQIGNGIFKLIGGVFDIITSPFNMIFDLISSIFDFDFLGYLETTKQVMGVIRGFKGGLLVMKNSLKQNVKY